MLDFWVIEYVAERPSCWIADNESGRPTFSFLKAKRFESREAADTAIVKLKLTWEWKVVAHTGRTVLKTQ